MKLATLKNGTRDGALCVVTKNLKFAAVVSELCPTLQAALDDWTYVAPQLQARYDALNREPGSRAFEVDFSKFHSPLPRAYQWCDASAYTNHVELMRRAMKVEMVKESQHEPLMYQGGSDAFLAPRDPIVMESAEWGIDFEGEIAIITDDVPMGVKVEKAGNHIRLLMLVNDVSLRELIPAELAKGFGFLQSKPSSAFAPIAVTPDELGDAWDGKRLHRPLTVQFNGKAFGKPNAGEGMTFHFPKLIAHAAKSRPLAAGTIVGSGTVSNKDRGVGSACLAERRAIETIDSGAPTTGYMQFGDRVRIEMLDANGQSIFGAIEQEVVEYKPRERA